jgi:hypothetical protein
MAIASVCAVLAGDDDSGFGLYGVRVVMSGRELSCVHSSALAYPKRIQDRRAPRDEPYRRMSGY